jgi:hypothetical protein
VIYIYFSQKKKKHLPAGSLEKNRPGVRGNKQFFNCGPSGSGLDLCTGNRSETEVEMESLFKVKMGVPLLSKPHIYSSVNEVPLLSKL